MQDYRLFWGDMHTHFEDLEYGDELLKDARENIDFTVVLLYPFVYEFLNGLRVETTGNRPEFLAQWERINQLARRHNDPGRFTTFPGYEWHGNRTKYGDHNVVYLHENQLLDDAWSLPDLHAALKPRQAFAIPHHTGYRVGARGKDWQYFDPQLSPVMELYSQHGSSEGVGATDFMAFNSSMGPGDEGGAYREALIKGLRVGAIGSNDGAGLPGRWGMGRAAVWAAENSREAIWDSILNHRTYAVTGDRIRVDCSIGDAQIGSETVGLGDVVDVTVSVKGSQEIDKLELVQNGQVVAKYAHIGRNHTPGGFPDRIKLFLEVGWGPAAHNGFSLAEETWAWAGSLQVQGGRILEVEKCFSLPGQKAVLIDPQVCEWDLKTATRQTRAPAGLRQGLIFELQVTGDTMLNLNCEGQNLLLPVQSVISARHLIPLLDEVSRLVKEQFGLTPASVANPDAYYQNARKIVLHRASPCWDYEVSHTFQSFSLASGVNSFYGIVTQANGQMAWTSPIWVST